MEEGGREERESEGEEREWRGREGGRMERKS